MRSFALPLLICLAIGMPSIAEAKKKHEQDTSDDKLSCKQLTGRMQVHIMELRGFSGRQQASALSRGIQAGFSATLGNTAHGIDPQGEHDDAIKQLYAYNQRLVEKGCKSYDLDAELKKNEIDDVPAPTIPAPKKKKPPDGAQPAAQ